MITVSDLSNLIHSYSFCTSWWMLTVTKLIWNSMKTIYQYREKEFSVCSLTRTWWSTKPVYSNMKITRISTKSQLATHFFWIRNSDVILVSILNLLRPFWEFSALKVKEIGSGCCDRIPRRNLMIYLNLKLLS